MLHPWARFFVEHAACMKLHEAFISPRIPQTDKSLMKKFVGLTKDTKQNRVYQKRRTFRVIANRPCSLRINDKGKKFTKKAISEYEFIMSRNFKIPLIGVLKSN